jgi:hypothetical protein
MDNDEKRRIREAHYATLGLFTTNRVQMPGDESTAEPTADETKADPTLDELREEYKKTLGKPPNQRWSAAYLQEQIKEAEAEIDKA